MYHSAKCTLYPRMHACIWVHQRDKKKKKLHVHVKRAWVHWLKTTGIERKVCTFTLYNLIHLLIMMSAQLSELQQNSTSDPHRRSRSEMQIPAGPWMHPQGERQLHTNTFIPAVWDLLWWLLSRWTPSDPRLALAHVARCFIFTGRHADRQTDRQLSYFVLSANRGLFLVLKGT